MEDGIEQHMSMLSKLDLIAEEIDCEIMNRDLTPENDSVYENNLFIYFYNECTQYIRILYSPYYIST